MRQYIEPFVNEPIWSSKTEEDTTSYYSETGELLAEVYFHEGTFFSATFYRTIEETTPITKEQAEQIAKKVKPCFSRNS